MRQRLLGITATVFIVLTLAACGGTPSLVGNWQADDGSGMKVISSSGACSGMFYSHGEPLDIGGPMSCSMGSKKDGQGRYSLVVTQSMNQETLKVSFRGKDEAIVYDSSGDRIFTMTRQ